MSKLKIANLFSKKQYLVSWITIIIALIIVFLDLLSKSITTTFTLAGILLVLSLLVIHTIIDSETKHGELVEKIDGFAKAEPQEKSLNILNTILSEIQKIKKPFLLKLNEIPSIEKYSENATELFFVGGHLGGLVSQYSNFFEDWLCKGKSLKFLLQNPYNEGLKFLEMPCHSYNYDDYRSEIENSLNKLYKIKTDYDDKNKDQLCNVNGKDQKKLKASESTIGTIDIRIYDQSPTQTLAILDGHIGGETAFLGLHIPYGDARTRPYFILNKKEHEESFNLFYSRYYVKLWGESKIYIPK